MDKVVECHFLIWGLVAFLTLALVVSVILNVSFFMKKKQKDYTYRDYQEYHPSDDDYYTEECPVYGNLNQEILALEECCYEQMTAQPQRPSTGLQVQPENQMCYASLDHSIKGKHRKPRKKKAPIEEEEDRTSKSSTLASKASIYLNSEQLAAENTETEAIHDDPIRLFGLIHKAKEKTFEGDS
ncbi:T-cell receptor-associated transmembrane adapter 1 [Alligator sinensis]|uniref:T-cell receptor-associated transmembrane adapter 1 n=1 Tax=Alligator sinensis TaxID=38654 RepID=UPI0003C28248|nr:T-cell receptor-associated transmembrane adapter 1 [Alligator sinensis]